MKLATKYDLADLVYLKASADARRGMVTGITARVGGYQYLITWGDTGEESIHYEIELADKPVMEMSS